MINVDGTLFVQIANFIVLIFILNFVLYRPIRGILKERSDKVNGLEQNIAQFKNESEEKDKAFLSGIKDARVRGLKEKEVMMAKAVDEEKAIIAKINEKALADLTAAKSKIGAETENVRNFLFNEIDTYANQITEKILGRSL